MKNEKRVSRSEENQLGERPSGKGREHPPRRTKKNLQLSTFHFAGALPLSPTNFFVLTQKSRQKKSRLRPYRSKNGAFAG
jgi:hypothetical protein